MAAHMTTMKPTSEVAAGTANSRSVAGGKTAPPQTDRPAKPIGRVVPKPFRPRVVGDEPQASVPAVILWDERVDQPAGAKPKG